MLRKVTTKILFLVIIHLVSLTVLADVADWRSIDIKMLHYLNSNPHPILTSLVELSNVTAGYIAISMIVMILVWGWVKRDRYYLKQSTGMVASALLTTLVTHVTKIVVSRPRPYISYPDLIVPLENLRSLSFPSGHTSAAFCAATALVMIFPKWRVAIPAFLWAGFAGYSRMYSGVHYPSDVLVGAMIGIGISVICYEINASVWKIERRI